MKPPFPNRFSHCGLLLLFLMPSAWGEYEKLLAAGGLDLKLDHILTIQTADQALWANVLLTVGVRTPDQ
jgi:hypothetical protein